MEEEFLVGISDIIWCSEFDGRYKSAQRQGYMIKSKVQWQGLKE